MSFELRVPDDVRFGPGRVSEVAPALVGLGVTRVLVVTGRRPDRAGATRRALREAGIRSEVFAVVGEPSVATVRDGVEVARSAGCDGVVGFGGGSALDTAKAVALLATSGADPLDHLEVVGQGRPVLRPGLPCVAVPTTAGTGSEVTRNAVLAHGGVKASLRTPFLLPRVALVDPDLLTGLPPDTVAASGSDALTQLVEPLLSRRATPVTDALAREGLRRSARSLQASYEQGLDGEDATSRREDLALASLLSGLCLANAGLGIVHGIAGVVGGRHDAPHGAVCAALLAPATAVTVRALRERAPDHPSLSKADELGPLLTGDPRADVEDALGWLRDLRVALRIPGLARWSGADQDALVTPVLQASSTRAGPVDLTAEEIVEILEAAR